jgi:hypothetical protein
MVIFENYASVSNTIFIESGNNNIVTAGLLIKKLKK